MSKLLKGLTVAAALLWAGSAQAAVTFALNPGQVVDIEISGGGPSFQWTDQGRGDYSIFVFYMAYSSQGCPPPEIDPLCGSQPFAAYAMGDYTAAPQVTTKFAAAGTWSSASSPISMRFTGKDNVYAVITGDDRWTVLPEPATWAMLLIGFGAIGGALRRRPNRPALSPTR